jgi:arginyl-tRNA synthetase
VNLLAELRRRFAQALEKLDNEAISAAQWEELARLVLPCQHPRFGDYQANLAMPLARQLRHPPAEIARQLAELADVSPWCLAPEVTAQGFINLRVSDERLAALLHDLLPDERLGVPLAAPPLSYVIDYSAPNVAKPMHVGHIRSTVIGDALYRTLKFLGHRVIGDNHLGDWGTQFGMIIYGYRHFRDPQAYARQPVAELGRLYRLVNQLIEHEEACAQLPELKRRAAAAKQSLEQAEAALRAVPPTDSAGQKRAAAVRRKCEAALAAAEAELAEARARIQAVESDPQLASLAAAHPQIGAAVLAETARLHAGDPENVRLWREFLPACRAEIDRIYARLGVRFDVTLGESFYHDRLPQVVDELLARGIAQHSEGAVCVFVPDMPAPMIVRKRDGAFLYATTDLATIQYRMETWSPDVILYVVDHRQSEHFRLLFAVARRWGYQQVALHHLSFGTVLGEDGRPFRTRSGDTVGLESLLDEAVARAYRIVCENDDQKPDGPELSEEERRQVAETVGIGAIKYADLSQHRTSDYVFSYEKMLATKGNTATYLQYAYARVRSIFRKGGEQPEAIRALAPPIMITTPAERALALLLVRFPEALADVVEDFCPNKLTAYLWELANSFSTFFEECPVLRAPTTELRHSRLALCDLTARVIRRGLDLLGIGVCEKM